MCFDCEQEGDAEDPGCGHPTVYCSCPCHEPDPERLDADEERWTCIGADCINPHVTHLRDECFTAEMAEEWHRDTSKPATRGEE